MTSSRAGRLRAAVRANWPILSLLFLAPAIPELLTGSTPVSEIAYNPIGFVIGFGLDVALYGSGALLIREFAVVYRKGWASILLLGAAYGIAEEGFEVHTFFQTSGTPVEALGSYGHLFGVNWIWALTLTIFHSTYSIALPILLTRLWFPGSQDERWLRRRGVGFFGGLFVVEVVGFGFLVGHGPSPAALGFFVGVAAVLIALALWAPRDLLRARPGRTTIGRTPLVLLGSVEFLVYFAVLIIAASRPIPALAAAALVIVGNAAVLLVIVRRVGTEGLERSEFRFAVGMLSVLFVWDLLLEFILVPGILAVSALFVYLLVRLDRSLKRREVGPTVPLGAAGLPPAGP